MEVEFKHGIFLVEVTSLLFYSATDDISFIKILKPYFPLISIIIFLTWVIFKF